VLLSVIGGGRVKNFRFSTASRPALGPTQPPIQWVPGALSPGVKPTTHLQLVPRSRKCGCIHPLPYTSSWRSAYIRWAQGQLYFCYSVIEVQMFKNGSKLWVPGTQSYTSNVTMVLTYGAVSRKPNVCLCCVWLMSGIRLTVRDASVSSLGAMKTWR
jgi:hypothetical protein